MSAHTCSCMSININPPLFDHLALHSYIVFLEFSHGFCSFQSELGFVFFLFFWNGGGGIKAVTLYVRLQDTV